MTDSDGNVVAFDPTAVSQCAFFTLCLMFKLIRNSCYVKGAINEF